MLLLTEITKMNPLLQSCFLHTAIINPFPSLPSTSPSQANDWPLRYYRTKRLKTCHCPLSGLAKRSPTSSNPIHSSSTPSSYTFFFPSLLTRVHIQVIYDFPFLPTHAERSYINHAFVYSATGYRLRFMGTICLPSTFTAHAPSSLAQITGD